MKPIPIRGHYGTVTCHLSELSPDIYRFKTVDDFCRFGSCPDGILYVDPSGGPMIEVGDYLHNFNKELPNRKIGKIGRDDGGVIFELETEQ